MLLLGKRTRGRCRGGHLLLLLHLDIDQGLVLRHLRKFFLGHVDHRDRGAVGLLHVKRIPGDTDILCTKAKEPADRQHRADNLVLVVKDQIGDFTNGCAVWPDYEAYQQKTERQIPVWVLEPV